MLANQHLYEDLTGAGNCTNKRIMMLSSITEPFLNLEKNFSDICNDSLPEIVTTNIKNLSGSKRRCNQM